MTLDPLIEHTLVFFQDYWYVFVIALIGLWIMRKVFRFSKILFYIWLFARLGLGVPSIYGLLYTAYDWIQTF